MEKDFCNKCGECCRNIAVDFTKKVIFRDGVQDLTPEFAAMLEPVEKKENITICKCKYLKENLCTRNPKPIICENYPSSPFAFIQENCGYYGEIFMKRESFLQKLRKMQEEILDYEMLMQNCSNDEAKQYKKIIQQHQGFINRYKIYCPEL